MATRKRPAKMRSPVRPKRKAGASSRKGADTAAGLRRQLADSKRELRKAHEQQAVISEVLRVINASPADSQPVFDAIVKTGVRLFDSMSMSLRLICDQVTVTVASTLPLRGPADGFEAPLSDEGGSAARAIRRREIVHVPDIPACDWMNERGKRRAAARGFRAILCAPLLKEGVALGVLNVHRAVAGAFTDKEISLLRAFADQAVIAIVNARLFNETKEALEQQTATAEILKVISSSPTDVQPVFDAIVNSAVRLFGGLNVTLRLAKGEQSEIVASTRPLSAGILRTPMDDDRYPSSRAMLRREVVHIPNAYEAEWVHSEYRERARSRGFCAVAIAPMVREGMAIGVVNVNRAAPGPFTDKQIALLKTFADQAVIAIENVRLFKELQARNAEVTESLEQQTATADILKVISSSPTDLQPTFEAILESAARLCGAQLAALGLFDGENYEYVAQRGAPGEAANRILRGPFVPLPGTNAHRTLFERRPIHVDDLAANRPVSTSPNIFRELGVRTILSVPMLKEGRSVGTIVLYRLEVRPFEQKQIDLLMTFANQAVIAIENARLFKELQARNAQVTEALEQQTATADVLRVISGSPTDVQPVFDAIAANAARLCAADDVLIRRFEGDAARVVAHIGSIPVQPESAVRPLNKRTFMGAIRRERRTLHVPDAADPRVREQFPDSLLSSVTKAGVRTVLNVPLIREDEAIGVIVVRRLEVRPFSERQIELLETFAAQAVIAIENVRLFNETKEGLERQTATTDILKVISGSPTDTQPVFDAIVRNATVLCESVYASVFRYDGDMLHLVATDGMPPDAVTTMREAYPGRPSMSRVSGRVILMKQIVHVEDVQTDPDYDRALSRALGDYARVLGVPMLREGSPVGVIVVGWAKPGRISKRHEELLQTFADQAVIAIENVRLFKELQARNAEVTEALQQQTVTADILKVISSSPTDVQPVFDAIAKSGVQLFQGMGVGVRLVQGDVLERVAFAAGPNCEVVDDILSMPVALDDRSFSGRAAIRREVVHAMDVFASDFQAEHTRALATRMGYRACAAAPLLRNDRALGVIVVTRAQSVAFSDKELALLRTFADQAVIAIENVRLFKELQARNAEVTEALEQQTATAEILRVISSSPTDTRPVFDAVLESATRLCDAHMGILSLYDGAKLRRVAQRGASAGFAEWIAHNSEPYVPPLSSAVGRLIAERRVIHIPDLREAAGYRERSALSVAIVELGQARTFLAVPLLQEGRVIGCISIFRPDVRPFADKQIELVTTFSSQAVIAIENVRLFNETKEALERQTATADILRVISSSPTDIQPVLNAVAETAARLCGATDALIRRVDGEVLLPAAHHGAIPSTAEGRPIDRISVMGKAVLERRTIHIHDVLAPSEAELATTAELGRRHGFRTVLVTPLLREGQSIGAIAIRRAEVRPFSDAEIEMLETFAAQAVIAIENVRLFRELQARNAEVTEALEQQTATADILKVISTSPTDVQPVFDTIATSALRLCEGNFTLVTRFDGTLIHIAALSNLMPEAEEAIRSAWPAAPGRANTTARCIAERQVVQILDINQDPDYQSRNLARAANYRSVLAVPLMREGEPLGSISVARAQAGEFPDHQVTLLETFAAQAVIAIENVRLFKELQARNAEVTEALEQQTVTADILKVISSSPTDVQPVFDSILTSATRLCEAFRGALHLYDGEAFTLVAEQGASTAFAEFRKKGLLRPGPLSGLGQMTASKSVVHVADLAATPGYAARDPIVVASVELDGTRTYLAVPMLKEGSLIGAITFRRQEIRPFSDNQIALLQTFADQAVIAIENVRLFKELQARNAEVTEALEHQTATSEVLRVISRSPVELDPVYSAILESITRLCEAHIAALFLYDGEALATAASYGATTEFAAHLRASRPRPSRETTTRLAALERRVVQAADLLSDASFVPSPREIYERENIRTVLSVPMLRDDQLVGVITIWRREVRLFTDQQVELVKTFADQATIAIANVRLFQEIQDKSRQVEVANRHKSEFLAHMSHELRTPLNAIIGFSEVLTERMFGEINAKQDEYLRDIHSSGQHLLSLINDILDLSKIEAGRMELELSDFHLPSALQNALTLVRERAQNHGIALKLEMDPQVGNIRADERKVKQIVLNLLSNAVKFTPDGGRVELDACLSNGAAVISVKDTGVGITPEDQASLFEEFRQVGGDRARKQEGTGLGLALTRRFVELHGGQIKVDSAPGKGSTFTFILPLR